MRSIVARLLRPLLCAKCGKQLHECACEEITALSGA
jgi:DTW domain-containing protein YfiP